MASQTSYLFSTRTSRQLAEKIAHYYGQELGKINFQEFSDGEFEPVLDQSVRGGRVFLIGSTFPPADNLLELLLMIDAAKRAKNYANHLGAEVTICYKERKKANEIAEMTLIGNVEDRNVILVDDMVDTAGTLCKAADIIMERGAKSVRAIATHGVLSGKAYENIEKSKLQEIIITDSIPLKNNLSSKIKVLSCAPLFADVMNLVHNKKSINDKFIF